MSPKIYQTMSVTKHRPRRRWAKSKWRHPSALIATKPLYATRLGAAYSGDARDLIKLLPAHSVDAIIMSPPYALHFKKSYGNPNQDEYIDWFMSFADEFRRVLRRNGSLVIEIGGAWNRGEPTRSIYHFELLVRLVKEGGFAGREMPSTILSLNRGNKKAKPWLTGKHGQGASSTYQYSDLTLIASRKCGSSKVAFTFVEGAWDSENGIQAKTPTYKYLTIDGKIPEIEISTEEFSTGTLVRHIGYFGAELSNPIGENSLYGSGASDFKTGKDDLKTDKPIPYPADNTDYPPTDNMAEVRFSMLSIRLLPGRHSICRACRGEGSYLAPRATLGCLRSAVFRNGLPNTVFPPPAVMGFIRHAK